MRGFDAFAGVIKSGGKTRRAAKMVILNVDHPDIVDFIECKAKEEAKAHTLIAPATTAPVRTPRPSPPSSSRTPTTPSASPTSSCAPARTTASSPPAPSRTAQPVKTYKARDIMHKIAEATWQCGDPGMQFDTTINHWHTSKNTGRINASNPCSEYMFLDNSACNLASFNLMKFVTPTGTFDIPAYRHAIDVVITAMEILVDNSGYPTETISRNSHDYRPLGLGYANLGALLMTFGLPYDSDAGRDFAATLTAIMCGQAYLQSAAHRRKLPVPSPRPLRSTRRSERQGRRLPRLLRQPRAVPRRHPHASRRGQQDRLAPKPQPSPSSCRSSKRSSTPARECWDKALAHGEKLRLSQLAGHRARAHRHHRLHDGLRHHRHRA